LRQRLARLDPGDSPQGYVGLADGHHPVGAYLTGGKSGGIRLGRRDNTPIGSVENNVEAGGRSAASKNRHIDGIAEVTIAIAVAITIAVAVAVAAVVAAAGGGAEGQEGGEKKCGRIK
jgi:hypothetical protein